MKICNVCLLEKEDILFPKWRKACRKCCIEENKKWKENNKKILVLICVDCGDQYNKILYSTEKVNIRCKKCSVKNTYKNKLNTSEEKLCIYCNELRNYKNFYKGYRKCKYCLFKKRNERYNKRIKEDIIYRMRHNIKVTIRKSLLYINLKKQNKKTVDILGCDIESFKL